MHYKYPYCLESQIMLSKVDTYIENIKNYFIKTSKFFVINREENFNDSSLVIGS